MIPSTLPKIINTGKRTLALFSFEMENSFKHLNVVDNTDNISIFVVTHPKAATKQNPE